MTDRKPGDGHEPHPDSNIRLNHCFGCGKHNPEGMQLEFVLDESKRHAICHFELTRRFEGPPGHVHGGIIATILDEAMGKVNKFNKVIGLTKRMEVEYLKPVPLGKPLTVTAFEHGITGREHTNVGEICNEQGVLLARGIATFVVIDPARMMAKLGQKTGQ